MIKTLTNVGNSKALILPKRLVNKYKLDQVSIRETDEGILIVPAKAKPDFHERLEKLRKNKKVVYERIAKQASDPETNKYYAREALHEIDTDIIEE
jgi:antitoxin component of MazEF toxin-antitoxin module